MRSAALRIDGDVGPRTIDIPPSRAETAGLTAVIGTRGNFNSRRSDSGIVATAPANRTL